MSMIFFRLLDPSKFEVLDAELDGTPGPYLSRIGRQNNQHDLLKDWQIMVSLVKLRVFFFNTNAACH